MDQVDLAQVRPRRIACDARAVLHRLAGMRVTFDSDPDEQADALLVFLADPVGGAATDS
jgi:hypothetical protein